MNTLEPYEKIIEKLLKTLLKDHYLIINTNYKLKPRITITKSYESINSLILFKKVSLYYGTLGLYKQGKFNTSTDNIFYTIFKILSPSKNMDASFTFNISHLTHKLLSPTIDKILTKNNINPETDSSIDNPSHTMPTYKHPDTHTLYFGTHRDYAIITKLFDNQ